MAAELLDTGEFVERDNETKIFWNNLLGDKKTHNSTKNNPEENEREAALTALIRQAKEAKNTQDHQEKVPEAKNQFDELLSQIKTNSEIINKRFDELEKHINDFHKSDCTWYKSILLVALGATIPILIALCLNFLGR